MRAVPSPPGESVVTRAAGRPARDRVAWVLSQIDALPRPTTVLAGLSTLPRDDDAATLHLIQSDEQLAGLAGAAAPAAVRRNGHGGPVGRTPRRNAALVRRLHADLARCEPAEGHAPLTDRLFQHGVRVACCAELIAERLGKPDLQDLAFPAGLLHDVGKLALHACFPKSYARLTKQDDDPAFGFCDLEQDAFGCDHTVAGKRLATRWGLPRFVAETAWLHHAAPGQLPTTLVSKRLVMLVALANNLVHLRTIGYGGQRILRTIEELSAALGVEEPLLRDAAERTALRTEEVLGQAGLAIAPLPHDPPDAHARSTWPEAVVEPVAASPAAEPAPQGAAVAALRQFVERLQPDHDISDVCAAAAQACRAALDAPAAIAIAVVDPGGPVYVGVATADENPCDRFVWPAGGEAAQEAARCLHDLERDACLAPAPPACLELAARAKVPSSRHPWWALPIRSSRSACGAVILTAPADHAHAWQHTSDAAAALAAAIGMAVSSAATRAELERMSEELLDASRRANEQQEQRVRQTSLAVITEMADGAAHELNNPLAVISGRAQLLLQHCDNEEAARGLKTIIEQAERASRIVLDLMRFAKPEPPAPAVHRISALLQPLCRHWQERAGLRPEQLTLSIADSELTLYADNRHFFEIMDAVLANAVASVPAEAARLRVNSRSYPTEDRVRIVVEDNGMGMTREVFEHALDPFFSHRPAGRGRGLGLSRAYRLAEINGGRLWLDSTPNVGTRATIEMPTRRA